MNTFGNKFRLTTFGESHGVAVGGVVDGCPAGMRIDMDLIARDLGRRQGDGSGLTTARHEDNSVEWLSGIAEGVTLGTPIAFAVRNTEQRSADYEALRDAFRPGHADYTTMQRYGVRDYRGGGRASGRETVSRVVGGAIARQLLRTKGVTISAVAETSDAMPEGDTYGGVVRCRVEGVPAGVGNPVFGRLNAMLASAMMSIPSAVAFEMGAGREAALMTGREWADAWNFDPQGHLVVQRPTLTNHCGGVQGGISNGMPVEFAVTFHAVVTQQGSTVMADERGCRRVAVLGGRHDHCHVLRLPVVVEAMAALVLADLMV